ncbi:MAG: hypothetical protein ACLQO1_03530 [Steroidobacteraceae bacterium]
MNYEDRVLCFVDILGFRSQIKETLDTQGQGLPAKIKNITDAFMFIRELLDIDKPDENRGRAVTQFSDSIVISFPIHEQSEVFWTLNELLSVQVNLVWRGMLCRGAAVQSKVIHTDRIIFGPAMVEAYDLESKAAIFPRIILGDSLLEVAKHAHAPHHSPELEVEAITSMLQRDTDGMWYIDYITRAQGELGDPEEDYPVYLDKLTTIVRNGMQSRDVPLRLKYQWIREKLAPHVAAVKASSSRLPDGDERKDAYASLPDL